MHAPTRRVDEQRGRARSAGRGVAERARTPLGSGGHDRGTKQGDTAEDTAGGHGRGTRCWTARGAARRAWRRVVGAARGEGSVFYIGWRGGRDAYSILGGAG
jgi:hypothetical protein